MTCVDFWFAARMQNNRCTNILEYKTLIAHEACTKIVVHMTDNLICPRCSLRLVGCQVIAHYHNHSEQEIYGVLVKQYLQHCQTPFNSNFTCFLCFNMFRDFHLAKLAQSAATALSDYTIKIPLNVQVKVKHDKSFSYHEHLFLVLLQGSLLGQKHHQKSIRENMFEFKKFLRRLVLGFHTPVQWRPLIKNINSVQTMTSEEVDFSILISYSVDVKRLDHASVIDKKKKKKRSLDDEDDNEPFDNEDIDDQMFEKKKHEIHKTIHHHKQDKREMHTFLTCYCEPILVAGNYNKYERGLSNSPWFLDKTRVDSSVETCISNIVREAFKCKNHSFFSCGREDIDVRMLGNGREFVFSFEDARNPHVSLAELASLNEKVNQSTDSIQIENLHLVQRDYILKVQSGAQEKRKNYKCVVWLSSAITSEQVLKVNALKELVVSQKTPIRVLHRRAIDIRKKLIHSIHCEKVNAHYMVVELETQAGTYVKEFINGDLGRTLPNLGSLFNCRADILQLDVVGITM